MDALAELWIDLAADQQAHGSHLLAAANRASIRESLAQRVVSGGVFVAREDADGGDILGFVTFYPESGGYEQDTDRGVVENLYVVPGRRGEGIGSDLLTAAENALADGGMEAVTLDAMVANEAARRFYRRHGYEPHRVEFERRLERETDTNEGGG
ncbi:GNAT family N-acetyltransferase [Halobacteriales archaeon QS_9_67_17]|nr:MAG: GNAT family N-acetyltransferase [Halobacteriales archaeon QS_9_67_17]